MKRYQLGLLIVGVVGAPVVLVWIFRMIQGDDWTQFPSELIAGLVAVAIGLPAGLWVSRLAERFARAENRRMVLDSLRSELRQQHQLYGELLRFRAEHPGGVPMPQTDCRTHFWEALGASSGLASIEDANLMGALAKAYYYATNMNRYIHTMHQIHISSPIHGPFVREAMGQVWEFVGGILPDAHRLSGMIVKAIDDAYPTGSLQRTGSGGS